MSKSELELDLLYQMRDAGLPDMEVEYKFHPTRKWRFDFAWPSRMIAVEIEGGTWSNGRHNRGEGYEKDLEKYNAATRLGWQVYRFTGRMVESGEAVLMIEKILEEAFR